MSIAVVCLLLSAAGGSDGGAPALSMDALRPEAEQILKAFSDGRLEAVEARFVEALRPKVRAARESFAAQRAERGAGTVSLTLCPSAGAWRPFQVEVEPVMTPALFEKMLRSLVASELHLAKADLRCPPGLVAIGETVTCEIVNDGRKLKVLRSANSHIEVEPVR